MSEDLKPCPFCGGEAKCYPSDAFNECGYFEFIVQCGSVGNHTLVNNYQTEAEAIAAWNARAELGSDDRNDEIYNAGFMNGIQAVFQQLEGIESYEELQDLIAEYWGEGEGYDEP